MEKINFAEQKISLAQTILALTDTKSFFQIQKYINDLYSNKEILNEYSENDYDAKVLTFKQWNKQFEDDYKLDDYIAEYGMSLRDFRMKIYNSEKEKGMSKQEFVKKVNAWK